MSDIRPCPDCERLTRPPSARLADHPGTLARRYNSGKCNTCHYKGVPVIDDAPARMSIDEISAGLAHWLHQRRMRITT